MDKKYELTSVTATIGRTQLYQIREVRSNEFYAIV